MALTNNAEGGTNGTTVTTANSGGASGTAWDVVSGAPTFDNAHPAHGTLGYKFVGGASAQQVQWTTSLGTLTDHYWRSYLYYTAFVDAGHSTAGFVIAGHNGSTNAWRVEVDNNGTITIRDTSQVVQATFTTKLSLNTLYRLEGHMVESATAMTADVRLFVGDSVPFTEEQSASFAGQASINQLRFGPTITGTGTPTMWMDDIAGADTTWFGPNASPPVVAKIVTQTQALNKAANRIRGSVHYALGAPMVVATTVAPVSSGDPSPLLPVFAELGLFDT